MNRRRQNGLARARLREEIEQQKSIKTGCFCCCYLGLLYVCTRELRVENLISKSENYAKELRVDCRLSDEADGSYGGGDGNNVATIAPARAAQFY